MRRNLRSAAGQVPEPQSPDDLSVVFIGSAIPNSANDVHAALFGTVEQDPDTGATATIPGYFSADTGEFDLAHIQAVLFFSILYEESSRPGRARVRRTARAFPRPDDLTAPQESAVAEMEEALSTSEDVAVTFRSG